MSWRLSLVLALALAGLAGQRPAAAQDAGVAYGVDFTGYKSGPVLDWLKGRGFVAKQDAGNAGKIVLAIKDDTLVLEAKRRALGLLLNEKDVPGSGRIRIEWGVDAFPPGASYDKGVRSEAIMIFTFFGKKKVSSGSLLVPDSPYFIGLFLCESGKTDHPFTGRFFKAGGRYVCVHTVKIGEKVVSEFDLGKAAEGYFKLTEVPPISGFAIGIDTDNAKAPGTAKSWVKKVDYLN